MEPSVEGKSRAAKALAAGVAVAVGALIGRLGGRRRGANLLADETRWQTGNNITLSLPLSQTGYCTVYDAMPRSCVECRLSSTVYAVCSTLPLCRSTVTPCRLSCVEYVYDASLCSAL